MNKFMSNSLVSPRSTVCLLQIVRMEAVDPKEVSLAQLYAPGLDEARFLALYERWERAQVRRFIGDAYANEEVVEVTK